MVKIFLTVSALLKELEEIKRDNNGQNMFDCLCCAQSLTLFCCNHFYPLRSGTGS